MPEVQIAVLITAAGHGKRLGGHTPKQFLTVANRPILAWTIQAFHQIDWIRQISLVVPDGWQESAQSEIIDRFNFTKVKQIITGGQERQDSVFAGLQALQSQCNWIIIHDGVRPFIQSSLVKKVYLAAKKFNAAVVGYPSRDTIKQTSDSQVIQTVDRSHLWLVQTPQVFKTSLITKAHQAAQRENFIATDDTQLVERLGKPVHVILGDHYNIKITTREDLEIAKQLLPIYFPEHINNTTDIS